MGSLMILSDEKMEEEIAIERVACEMMALL